VNFVLDTSSDLADLDPITVFNTQNFKYMKNVFRELSDTWKNKRPGYEMRAIAYVYELFSELIAEKSLEKLNKKGYCRLLPAKKYIDSNCEKTITISFLASLCKMSETNFRRAFLAATGETPLRYRDRVLIELAKDYLLSGFYTVTETAEKCGFDDPSYFGRFFKKHTGVSPGKFIYK
jgi:AraC-like DNA-binding protein